MAVSEAQEPRSNQRKVVGRSGWGSLGGLCWQCSLGSLC